MPPYIEWSWCLAERNPDSTRRVQGCELTENVNVIHHVWLTKNTTGHEMLRYKLHGPVVAHSGNTDQ